MHSVYAPKKIHNVYKVVPPVTLVRWLYYGSTLSRDLCIFVFK